MSTRSLLLCLPMLLLGACSPMSDPNTAPPVPDAPCDASTLSRFIGQKASVQTGTDMLAASGARSLRWVAPGMAVTMDFRADRLTVSYDAQMVIENAKCG